MRYITYFDWSALILLLIMFLSFNVGRNYHSSANRCYRRLIIVCFFATVFDLITAYIDVDAASYPMVFIYFANMMFLGAQNLLPMCYMAYCAAYTELEGRHGLRSMLSLTGPSILCIFLIITNPLTDFVFTVDDQHIYHQGTGIIVLYVIAALYLIGAAAITYRFRNQIPSGRRVTLYCFSLIVLSAAVFQFLRPEVLITDFAAVCGGVAIFVMVQNPADSVNRATGMFSREAFIASISDVIEAGNDYSIVIFAPDNLKNISQVLGYEMHSLFVKATAEYFERKVKAPIFGIEEEVFAILLTEQSADAYAVAELIKNRFDEPWNVSGLELSRTCSVAIFKKSPDFPNTEAVLVAVNHAAARLQSGDNNKLITIDNVPNDDNSRLNELEKQKLLLEAESREALLAKEKAERADREKSMFLANTSHEIRTPMNAILGMTDLILRDDINERVRADAEDIKSAGEALLAIINDVLDISKVESGKLEIACEEYDLRKVLADVIRLVATRINMPEVELQTEIDLNIPERLIGDEVRIRQILTNLLNNAAKFTKSGYIKLRISGKVENYVFNMHVEIEDSGEGIKEEDKDRLFQAFSRIENGSNRYIEGTGLGLALCKQLLNAMGGDIYVDSEYGKGCTFSFNVPQRIVDDYTMKQCIDINGDISVLILNDRFEDPIVGKLTEALGQLEIPYAECGDGREVESVMASRGVTHVFAYKDIYYEYRDWFRNYGSPEVILLPEPDVVYNDVPEAGLMALPVCSIMVARHLTTDKPVEINPNEGFRAPDAAVLLVDDNIVNLKVAEGLLKCYDINADSCMSGADAIDKAAAREYDIIFMDHMMPQMDGVEAMHRIRGLGGHNREVVMVALTANAVSGVKNMFMSEGFDDYLSKPMVLAELEEVLRKHLTGRMIKSGPARLKSLPGGAAYSKNRLPELAGVDVERGLTACSRNRERYDELLDTFLKSGNMQKKQLVKLSECNNLRSLWIEMHALAALAASIGATNIEELARKTESAAKRGDSEEVKSSIDVLVHLLDHLLIEIDMYFTVKNRDAVNAQKEGERLIEPERLKGKLELIAESLEEYNDEAARQYIDNLAGYTLDRRMREKLDNLLEIIERFEYDEAHMYVEGLIKNV